MEHLFGHNGDCDVEDVGMKEGGVIGGLRREHSYVVLQSSF